MTEFFCPCEATLVIVPNPVFERLILADVELFGSFSSRQCMALELQGSGARIIQIYSARVGSQSTTDDMMTL